jgi:anaerobic magnesium-protoporphyrin IX monomethyl ester cyclase
VAHSYFLNLDPKQAQKMRPYPPLATLYVAATLRNQGHSVEVFDAMLANDERDFELHLARSRPQVVVIYEDNFNFLSKMCLTRMREAALAMTTASRLAGAAVIVSGSDVTDHSGLYLSAGAHACALGEGDHTVREWVGWLADGHEPSTATHLSGLALPEGATHERHPDEVPLRTPKRANERHPDVFGLPARDLVDIDAYRKLWLDRHQYFSLNMVSTRGCPFHCNWCAKPIWGQRYAMREAKQVAGEMDVVKREIAPDHIWFADDIFGLRPSWVTEFADEVDRLDAHIPFTMQSRCDLMTEESVAGLRRAGCREVWLGAESGSQAVLDAMDKGTSVDDIRTARARLGAAGIRACFFVQFGFPGETWDDIQATIALIRETMPDDIGVSVSYPLPGTRFHTMVRGDLDGKANWAVSNDLEMMFHGTYTSPFYRRLHLALHDDLDVRRRIAGHSRAKHASLPDVSIEEHHDRVATGWAEVHALEASCRNDNPTTLVRVEPAPLAPDLSRTHN